MREVLVGLECQHGRVGCRRRVVRLFGSNSSFPTTVLKMQVVNQDNTKSKMINIATILIFYVPRRSQSDSLGKEVVVDESSVNGKQSHQKNDVATTKHSIPNLELGNVDKQSDNRSMRSRAAYTSPPSLKFFNFSSFQIKKPAVIAMSSP